MPATAVSAMLVNAMTVSVMTVSAMGRFSGDRVGDDGARAPSHKFHDADSSPSRPSTVHAPRTNDHIGGDRPNGRIGDGYG